MTSTSLPPDAPLSLVVSPMGREPGSDDDVEREADERLVSLAELRFEEAMKVARQKIADRKVRTQSEIPLGGFNAAELMRMQIPDVEWIIEGILQREAVGLIGAEYKGCKSWLACDVAVSISSGEPLLGKYRVERPGWVLYIAFEDSVRNMRSRLRAIAVGRRLDLDKALGRIQVIPRPPSLNMATLDGQAWIVAQAMAMPEPPVLVIVDPLGNAHQAKSENDEAEMKPAMTGFRVARDATGASFYVPHHMGKPPKDGWKAGRIEDKLRGSSVIFQMADAWLLIDRRRYEESDEHRRWDAVIVAGTREGGVGNFGASLDVRLKRNKTADVAAWAPMEIEAATPSATSKPPPSAKGSELVLHELTMEAAAARQLGRAPLPLSTPEISRRIRRPPSTVGDWISALKSRGVVDGDRRGVWLRYAKDTETEE